MRRWVIVEGGVGRPFPQTATLSFVVLVWCTCSFALNPDLVANQHTHATVKLSSRDIDDTAQMESQQVMEQSWGVQQGAPPDIRTIVQTADGFLWLGSSSGLFRFDGTHFERFRPSSGDQLLSSNVLVLFAPPTGGLWVGYFFRGFSFVNDGRVTNYGGMTASSSGTVYTLAEDSKETLWAGTGSGVWRFEGSKWEHLGAEWGVPTTIRTVGVDRTDTVWVINGFSKNQMLLYLLPGSKRFQLAAAIRDLRPEPAAQRDLPELLNGAGRELAMAHAQNGVAPSYRVVVEGKQLGLSPMLQDEVFRISREVIRNAFAHAAATLIEVEIRYDQDQLRVRIRDDGKGIEGKILEAGGQSGHFGIPGIRERAERVGASLDFWSEMGAGTEMELTVPAAMAYQRRRHRRRFRLFNRDA